MTLRLGEFLDKIAEAGWGRDLPVKLQDDYGREFTPDISFSDKPYHRVVIHIKGSPIEAEADG